MNFKRKYKKLPPDATFSQIMRNSFVSRYTNKRYYEYIAGEKFLIVETTDNQTDEVKIKKYSCSAMKSKVKKKKGYISLF